jgi:tetratricopeptide (TPR) repeat protein
VLSLDNFKPRNARTSASLMALFAEKSAKMPCAVADLTLGSWTPHSIEAQWLGQILQKDVVFKSDATPLAAISSLGDAMYASIDEESLGARAPFLARRAARQLSRVLARRPAALIVLVPCFSIPWRDDDALLLEYLNEIEPGLDLTFAIAGDQPSAWPTDQPSPPLGLAPAKFVAPADNVLYAVPSAISPSVLGRIGALAGLIPITGGWALVAPESRQRPALDRTAVKAFKAIGLDKLSAYASLHGQGANNDAWLLCAEAWKQCHSGYRELGLTFIAAAENAATNILQREALRSQKQAMRIATSRFQEAAEEQDTADSAPPALAGIMNGLKGWGLVMAGQPSEAQAYLAKALALGPSGSMDKAYLFLKNIHALALLRSGHPDEALSEELCIEAAISTLPTHAAALNFVNALNLARLYRYSRDFKRARAYYTKAFDTCDGSRTETDAVNQNLCFARLAEDEAHHREALLCWLRAALQWCANDCPEALNWRSQALVTGSRHQTPIRGLSDARRIVEALAEAFVESLDRVATLCGMDCQSWSSMGSELPIVSTDVDDARLRPVRYIGGNGWAVVGCVGKLSRRSFGPSFKRLLRWLNHWIQDKTGIGTENCYAIDRYDGREMPVTHREMLGSAIDFSVYRFVYDGVEACIDSTVLETWRDMRVLTMGPMIAHADIEGSNPQIIFKRYLRPIRLDGHLLQLFRAIRSEGGSIIWGKLREQGWAEDLLENTAAQLRRARAIQIRMPPSGGYEAMDMTL